MVSLRSEGRKEAPRLLFCLWGHEEQTERQGECWRMGPVGPGQGSEWLLVIVKGWLCSR